MKKFILVLFFVLINLSKAHWNTSSATEAVFFTSSIGFQRDFYSNNTQFANSFDVNFVWLFPNISLNYNTQYGTTIFGGVGIGNILQIQYGLQLEKEEMLMRIRSDIPLILFDKDNEGFLKYPIVGVYYLKSYKLDGRPETFGITIAVDTFELIKGINNALKKK